MKSSRPLLFDLQALLSWAGGDVPDAVIRGVGSGSMIYVSAVSPWEFILKERKYQFNIDYAQLFQTIKHLQAELLPIKTEHLQQLRSMAIVKDGKGKEHNDPFDRLIIAQAIHEDLVLVGGDHMFPAYQREFPLQLLWEA